MKTTRAHATPVTVQPNALRPFSISRSRTVVHASLLSALLGALACSGKEDGTSIAAHGTAGAASTGATAGTSGVIPEVDSAARYFEPNHVVEVAIELEQSDWDALRTEKRTVEDIVLGDDCQSAPFPNPFTWKQANVTIDGTQRSRVGVRKKGFLGSLDEDRPSLRISIDQFVSQDLFGVRDFTLNNVKQDPAIISECLGLFVFAKVGLPAPRCNFAHLQVNGRDFGVFVNIEPIKKPLLRRFFTSDAGDLYEGTVSDFRDGWLGTFEPKTSDTDAGLAPLRSIANAVTATDGDLLARLGKVIDVEGFAEFWATEAAIAHVDGYSRNTNNFYVYRDPGSGLATLLPWGTDLLFGNADTSATTADPIGRYTQGVIANALYSSTDGRNILLRSLQSVLDRAWNESELVAEAQRMAMLVRPMLSTDRTSAFNEAQQKLRDFVLTRRAALAKAIASPPTTAQVLRGSACLKAIGTVSGSFVTTWGTVGADDPFSTGTGVLDVTVNGTPWPNLSGYVGAVSGLNSDSTAAQDSQVVIPALRTDGLLSVMAFSFDRGNAVPGSLSLDLEKAPGILLQLDPNVAGSEKVIGVVLGGTLVFDKIGTVSGDAVEGHFSGQLYDTPFLNGF